MTASVLDAPASPDPDQPDPAKGIAVRQGPTPTNAITRRATMAEKVHWAEQMARSTLVPDAYRGKPANLLFACEYAESLNLPTMAAIQGIHVIKGKPSASAALMTALVRNAGHRVRSGWKRTSDDGPWGIGWCEIVRKDDPDFTFRAEWRLDDAARAGLCTITAEGNPYCRSDKGEPQSWEKYPKAMLTWRAVTECVRQACEEVLYGAHYTPEEMGMEMSADGEPIIIEGELVRTNNIAPKLVGDPDPIDWAPHIAKAGTDPVELGKLLAWARNEAPEDFVLHDRISGAVPWQLMIDEAADRDAAVALYRRAKGMRPNDVELLARITAKGETFPKPEKGPQPGDVDDDGIEEADVVDVPPVGSEAAEEIEAHEAAAEFHATPTAGSDAAEALDGHQPPDGFPAPTKGRSLSKGDIAKAASALVTFLLDEHDLDMVELAMSEVHPAAARTDVSGLLGEHAETLDAQGRTTLAQLADLVMGYIARHGHAVTAVAEPSGIIHDTGSALTDQQIAAAGLVARMSDQQVEEHFHRFARQQVREARDLEWDGEL
jgi:hypothetical protein